jgi:Flp pilus assembly protein TadG
MPSTFDPAIGDLMHRSRIRRPFDRQRSRGQSLAEFALVFPVLMLILGAVIQFGIIFWGQNSLNQVVRDAGRYAVTEANCSSASQTDVSNQVTALTSSMGVAKLMAGSPVITMPTNGELIGGQTDPVSDSCPATSNADHVWIRIKVDAQVPIFFPFVPGGGVISSTALFRMEPVNP